MISLCGLGEPLLNKHAPAFARHVRDAGFRCAMSSNGALLDERRGSELLDAGLNEILINCGEQGEDYEAVYKLPWEKTRDNIIRFAEMAGDDCDVLLILVNHRRDAQHQLDMREFWGQHGIKAFHEYEIMNRGGSLFVDEMQYARHPESQVADQLLNVDGPTPICIAPFLGFFVGYDGNYYLCCSDWEKTVPVGTVFDDEFVDTLEAKLRYVSTRGPLCATCNHDPVNRITEDLRAVESGEIDRSTVDDTIRDMRIETKMMVEGLDRLVPATSDHFGKPPRTRRMIPVTVDPVVTAG
jgi:MoaA/NifB/PqqE/SkfB family radical SAM enzyme